VITFGGTQGKGMLAAAGRYRSAAERSPAEEPEIVAPVVDALLSESYDRRQTPEGQRWAPRVPPTGTWPLLEKTGAMRASQLVMPVPGAVSMSYAGPAQYHQDGTPRMAARPLLPKVYPPTWAARIGKARLAWWWKALVSP
jgi:hypothetical protein